MTSNENPAKALAHNPAPVYSVRTYTEEPKGDGAMPAQTAKRHAATVLVKRARMRLFLRKELTYRTRSGELIAGEVLFTTLRAWRRYPPAFRRRFFKRWSLGDVFLLAVAFDG